MTRYLIDTTGVSEFSKPSPAPQVVAWFDRMDSPMLSISVITLGEIRNGLELLAPGRKRTQLEFWLDVQLPSWFVLNQLPVTHAIADRWGRLSALGQRRGSVLAAPDGLIAATAFEHGLTLVTRNVKDFAGFGFDIFNPWEL